VTYDTSQKIEADKAFTAMQTPSIGATIKGISMKAADFAKCSFSDFAGKDLNNPPVIRAGQDVKIWCSWDEVTMKLIRVDVWEQGMDNYDAGNNQGVPRPPFNCLLNGKVAIKGKGHTGTVNEKD